MGRPGSLDGRGSTFVNTHKEHTMALLGRTIVSCIHLDHHHLVGAFRLAMAQTSKMASAILIVALGEIGLRQ